MSAQEVCVNGLYAAEPLFSSSEVIAGAIAGFAEHFVMFPCDTIKTRLQTGSSANVRAALHTIFRKERLTHLYRGCIPTLASAAPAHAAYFSVYEASKRTLGGSSSGIAISGVFATAAHDIVSTPFDVIKQRMQMDHIRSFATSIDCARGVMASEGPIAFIRSVPTTLAMNIPFGLTYWLVYENARVTLQSGHLQEEAETSKDFLLAGCVAGGSAAFISFPMDTIKTHQQLQSGRSFRHTVRTLIRRRGPRGLYWGASARIVHTSASGAIMMVTYENVKKWINHRL